MNGAAGNGEVELEPSVLVVEEGEEGAPPNAPGNGDGGGGGGDGVPPHAPNFGANESDTLLVVATLITALTYQLGTNIPGGYWQADDGAGHVAGDPIMRDKHRRRYWLFMAASWAGFGTSMLLTVGLITGGAPAVPVRAVRVPGGLLQPRPHLRDLAAADLARHGPRHLGRRHGAARRRHQVPAPRQAPRVGALPVRCPCSSALVLLLTFMTTLAVDLWVVAVAIIAIVTMYQHVDKRPGWVQTAYLHFLVPVY